MEVKQGLYWAKQKGDEKATWRIVFVKGKAPFLSVWPVVVNADSENIFQNSEVFLDVRRDVSWEFHSRIEYPQGGDA